MSSKTQVLIAILTVSALACISEEPAPPFPTTGGGGSGPVTIPGTDPGTDPDTGTGTDPGTDTDTDTDTDPGDGDVGDPCTLDDCGADLLCFDGYCHEQCDPDDSICAEDQLCISAVAPGVCVTKCSLINPDCPPDQACNRVYDSDDQVWAACTNNPGAQALGQECVTDSECGSGLLCAPALELFDPCVGENCCAAVCDDNHPCVAGQYCSDLEIPDQAFAGYCRVN